MVVVGWFSMCTTIVFEARRTVADEQLEATSLCVTLDFGTLTVPTIRWASWSIWGAVGSPENMAEDAASAAGAPTPKTSRPTSARSIPKQ